MKLSSRVRAALSAFALIILVTLTLLFLDEALLVRFASSEDPLADGGTEQEKLLVTRVIDGDTFELSNGKKVRLIGVDTPESVKPGTAVQCFGKEAADYLKKLIEGKEVRLERDVSETDRYGRLLRYAYSGDVFINEVLVREGYAFAVTFPPDIREQERFREAEREARAQKRGLFADETCDGKR